MFVHKYLDTDPKSTISFDLIPDAWFLSISFKSCHANSICQHYQRHSYIILILILYFLSILSSESYILNVTLISQYINIHPLNFRWLYVKDGLCGMFFPLFRSDVFWLFFLNVNVLLVNIMHIVINSSTTRAISGAGTPYPSGVSEFTPIYLVDVLWRNI